MVRPRPPINAATLDPTANSPLGQDLTRPTHSMPLTSAASAHSPLRMCISAWFTPNALTWMTTWPGFGSGSGISFDHQVFRATELLYDDCTHGKSSGSGYNSEHALERRACCLRRDFRLLRLPQVHQLFPLPGGRQTTPPC